MRWFVLDVNPEPWAVGPVGVARKGGRLRGYIGRNQQLRAYQDAIREALGSGHKMIVGPVALQMYFWRNRAEYETPQARSHRKHEADLTNLQKSTEDALQGVLFKNDKDVQFVHAIMVEQGPEVVGRMVIGITEASEPWWYAQNELPTEILADAVKLGLDGGSTSRDLSYDSRPEELF